MKTTEENSKTTKVTKEMLIPSRYKRSELPVTSIESNRFKTVDIEISTQRAEIYADRLLLGWPSVTQVTNLDVIHNIIIEFYSGKREVRLYSSAQPALSPADDLTLNLLHFIRRDVKKEYYRNLRQMNVGSESDFDKYMNEDCADTTSAAVESRDILNKIIKKAKNAKNNRFFGVMLDAVIKNGIPISKTKELSIQTGLPEDVIKREKVKLKKLAKDIEENDTG